MSAPARRVSTRAAGWVATGQGEAPLRESLRSVSCLLKTNCPDVYEAESLGFGFRRERVEGVAADRTLVRLLCGSWARYFGHGSGGFPRIFPGRSRHPLMDIYYQTLPPSAYLRPFIREHLLLDVTAGPGEVVPAKVLAANTEQCLVFYLRGHVTAVDAASGASAVYAPTALNGTQLSRFDMYITSRFRMLSVQFQPGVMSKFLRLPLAGFTNERIDAEAVLAAEIRQVQEQLVNAPSYAALIEQAEAYLWRRIQRLRIAFAPFDRALLALAAQPQSYALDQLAQDACLSVSQLERRFRQQLGVGPKLFGRICRFSQAHALKQERPALDWLQVAVECGYYDYQHLVKDFRQFAHATPPALLLAQAQAPDRLARRPR